MSIDTFATVRNVYFKLIRAIRTSDNANPDRVVPFDELRILARSATSADVDIILVKIKDAPFRVFDISSLPIWRDDGVCLILVQPCLYIFI